MTGEEKGRFGRVNGKGIERDRPVRQPNVINRDHKEIVMSFGLNGKGLCTSQSSRQFIE